MPTKVEDIQKKFPKEWAALTKRGKIFTATEAADYLGFKPFNLNALRSTCPDSPAFTKIGNRIFYVQPDLDAFKASKNN
ncbi:MAG: hypothetical protein HQK59_01735 [Deltaproteobacteria bacterium]|nr:hypothetical protein [Deltaproteobacteria bacterium]